MLEPLPAVALACWCNGISCLCFIFFPKFLYLNVVTHHSKTKGVGGSANTNADPIAVDNVLRVCAFILCTEQENKVNLLNGSKQPCLEPSDMYGLVCIFNQSVTQPTLSRPCLLNNKSLHLYKIFNVLKHPSCSKQGG